MRRKGPALARFASLLDSHRKANALTYAALARALPSPRERSDNRAAANTVSNWCKGTALPTEIEPLLRAVFGAERNSNAELREALRAAFNAAVAERHGAAIAGASPAGSAPPWVVAPDHSRFVHDPSVKSEDQDAAADPLHYQMQQAICGLAAQLAEVSQGRLGNSPIWKTLPDTAAAFRALVEREPQDVAARLGEAYPLMLQLGGFLNTDIRVQRDSMAADGPLDAEIHRPLRDLVRTAAPWLRDFPTVAKWDDEAGKLLMQPALLDDARGFTRAARGRRLISEADAERIDRLAATGQNSDDPLLRKGGEQAAADAYNLLLAVAGLAAAAMAGATQPARAELVRRAGATLADARGHVAAFAEGQPPDLREALQALSGDERRLERQRPVSPSATPEAVPEGVEDRARELILRGEAPPPAWHPFIHRLNFAGSDLDRLDLLSGLTALTSLDLQDTEVSDLSPLSAMTAMTRLDLEDTEVSDVSPLSGLTALTSLNLGGTQVSDASPLSALTALTSLDLRRTQVSDLSPLSAMTALTDLDLEDTEVSDVSPLSGLTALTSLNLGSTQVRDASPLSALTALTSLDLFGTRDSNVSPLSNLTALTRLDLGLTAVSDVSPLSGLTALTWLVLEGTQVSDVSPLSGLTALTTLDLSDTRVSDVSPLSGLTALTSLDLDGTQVTDVSPLAHLNGLEISGPTMLTGRPRARRPRRKA